MEWRSDTRAASTLTEILLWGIVGLIALMVVIAIVSAIVTAVVGVLTALVPILILGALIYLAVAYLRNKDSTNNTSGYGLDSLGGSSPETSTPQSPQDRLTEQYVRGDISEDEYERRIGEYVDREAGGHSSSYGSSDYDTDRSRSREFER
ncbi:SHOCT domain-containing protein [Natronolimnobius baerhuensis]|uniref:SHOCT domain-containing protein n=1 Tax=Natronolimnobius baerhuensis TaxID=253108 RepID=A0A202ECE0_9EURY|nr:hypothetical protein [Natronolimnobius baerhuensis]OVE85858.1 hypothetical protein B2G88_03330 [Natronolimnobius baerhuensis]